MPVLVGGAGLLEASAFARGLAVPAPEPPGDRRRPRDEHSLPAQAPLSRRARRSDIGQAVPAVRFACDMVPNQRASRHPSPDASRALLLHSFTLSPVHPVRGEPRLEEELTGLQRTQHPRLAGG